ncbi:MAG: hypothetical protein M1138_06885 [Candidatus Thermoplasmatota archaeon]|nr:hypothetical protein [Candidatus Thermoplasmatota archaeon]
MMRFNRLVLVGVVIVAVLLMITVPLVDHPVSHIRQSHEATGMLVLESSTNTTNKTIPWWQAAGDFLGSVASYVVNGAESAGSFFTSTVAHIGSFVGNLPSNVAYAFAVQFAAALLIFFATIAKGIYSIAGGIISPVLSVAASMGILGPVVAFLILVAVLLALYTVVETMVKFV